MDPVLQSTFAGVLPVLQRCDAQVIFENSEKSALAFKARFFSNIRDGTVRFSQTAAGIGEPDAGKVGEKILSYFFGKKMGQMVFAHTQGLSQLS